MNTYEMIFDLHNEPANRDMHKSFLTKMEVMEDDDRNPWFHDLDDFLTFGHSYRVVIEDLGKIEPPLQAEASRFLEDRRWNVAFNRRYVEVVAYNRHRRGYDVIFSVPWNPSDRPDGMTVREYAEQVAYESYRNRTLS